MLQQGEPRDAAVNFDTNRILQGRFLCHSTVFLHISDRSNAAIIHCRPTLILTAVMQESRFGFGRSRSPKVIEFGANRKRVSK